MEDSGERIAVGEEIEDRGWKIEDSGAVIHDTRTPREGMEIPFPWRRRFHDGVVARRGRSSTSRRSARAMHGRRRR